MFKYVQTQVPLPLFKQLKTAALERGVTLYDLLQEILEAWAASQSTNGKELKRTEPKKTYFGAAQNKTQKPEKENKDGKEA